MALLSQGFPSIRFSNVYETAPVGPAGPEPFWNLAAVLVCPQSLEILKEKLRQIEAELGRVRTPDNRFAPRVIDIDILPQKDYEKQAFIIVPLAEVAPLGLDEAAGKTFSELADAVRGEAAGFRLMA